MNCYYFTDEFGFAVGHDDHQTPHFSICASFCLWRCQEDLDCNIGPGNKKKEKKKKK
jgi:hypothetical protein